MKMTTLLAEKEHAIIQGAIYSIGNNSCVKFRPHTDEPDFVDIQNEEHEGSVSLANL
jgi:hypothetical protein